MPVQTLRGTRSFPHGRGAVSRRSLRPRGRAGPGDHERRRGARLRGRFWLNGQRLLEAYPAVPLNPANQGLTIGVLSYDGGVHFGLLADRDLDPPLAAMRAALEDAMNGRFAPPDRG